MTRPPISIHPPSGLNDPIIGELHLAILEWAHEKFDSTTVQDMNDRGELVYAFQSAGAPGLNRLRRRSLNTTIKAMAKKSRTGT